MLTIVWDVDDVLNDLMFQWFHHGWLMEHAECALVFDDLALNPPHEILGVDSQEYLDSMDRFRKTDCGLNLKPNPQVLAWFIENGEQFRHIALTARPLESAPNVADWIIRHFGSWIRCFGVVPSRESPGAPVYDRNKIDFLKWLRTGDILIDDTDENIAGADSYGMKTFQVAQPWNKSNLTTSEMLSQVTLLAVGD